MVFFRAWCYFNFYHTSLENKGSFKKQRRKSRISHCFDCGIVGGFIIAAIMHLLASRVVTIMDDHKYEDNYYLFKYVDNNKQTHNLSPFDSYIDNQSSHNIVIYKVVYSRSPRNSNIYSNLETYEYSPKKFKKLSKEPNYIFRSPPSSIFVKRTDNGVKWALKYKEDFEEVIINNGL